MHNPTNFHMLNFLWNLSIDWSICLSVCTTDILRYVRKALSQDPLKTDKSSFLHQVYNDGKLWLVIMTITHQTKQNTPIYNTNKPKKKKKSSNLILMIIIQLKHKQAISYNISTEKNQKKKAISTDWKIIIIGNGTQTHSHTHYMV